VVFAFGNDIGIRLVSAIEPIIGYLKSDFRLSRNLLKGQVGDEINVLMAACATQNPKQTHYQFTNHLQSNTLELDDKAQTLS
jgi:hypothetical protein